MRWLSFLLTFILGHGCLLGQSAAPHISFINPGINVGMGDIANRIMFQPDQLSSTTFEKRPVFILGFTNRIQFSGTARFVQAELGWRTFDLRYRHDGLNHRGSYSMQVNRLRWALSYFQRIMEQPGVFIKGGLAGEHHIFTTAERDWLQLRDFNFFGDVALAFAFGLRYEGDLLLSLGYSRGFLNMVKENEGYRLPVVELVERFFYVQLTYYPFHTN